MNFRLFTIIFILMTVAKVAIAGMDNCPQSYLSYVSPQAIYANDETTDSGQSNANTIIREDSTKITIEKGSPTTPSIAVDTLKAYKAKKRWPTGALLRSAFVPGLGQVYNHQYLKAVIYGGTEIGLIVTTRKYWRAMNSHERNLKNSSDLTYKAAEFNLYENSRDDRNLYLWLTGLTVLVSMFDAFVDAHLADFNQTDKAFQVKVAPRQDQLQLTLVYNFR